MTPDAALAALLPGAQALQWMPLQGGALSEVLRADLADGRAVVLKRGGLVGREARMLQALARSGARTPELLGHCDDALVLSYLPPAPPSPAGWRACGQSLLAAHATTGPEYGWPEDYAFGAVAIPNGSRTTWPEFWAERRLLPSCPVLSAPDARRLEALAADLGNRLPVAPPPALLHGDLWAGNVHFTGEGAALIDPACYYGDGEVDLAMLTLFGAPPQALWNGYGALAPDHTARRPIYQLWPALVHLRLFGARYLGMVRGLLDEAGA